jgi:hypothetical protein
LINKYNVFSGAKPLRSGSHKKVIAERPSYGELSAMPLVEDTDFAFVKREI